MKFTPFIDCRDTEWKTEENSSVENWKHLSYDGYLCSDGNDNKQGSSFPL